jgi:hypothetical protein
MMYCTIGVQFLFLYKSDMMYCTIGVRGCVRQLQIDE